MFFYFDLSISYHLYYYMKGFLTLTSLANALATAFHKIV